jgi:hypothetical protein
MFLLTYEREVTNHKLTENSRKTLASGLKNPMMGLCIAVCILHLSGLQYEMHYLPPFHSSL